MVWAVDSLDEKRTPVPHTGDRGSDSPSWSLPTAAVPRQELEGENVADEVCELVHVGLSVLSSQIQKT